MMRKYFLLLCIIILAVIGYTYINKPHRDIQSERSDFSLSSKELISAFLTSSKNSEKKYLNKVLEISGNISEIDNNSAVLDKSVFCKFNNEITNQALHKHITIKGRLIGYDDLLEEIKLDQCSFINK